jgi:L-asparagine permease
MISGWQSSPYFWHKTSFIVVVFGVPIIVGLLIGGWFIVRPKVMAHTNGQILAVWSDDGPTYPGLTPDELDRQNDPGTNPIDPEVK